MKLCKIILAVLLVFAYICIHAQCNFQIDATFGTNGAFFQSPDTEYDPDNGYTNQDASYDIVDMAVMPDGTVFALGRLGHQASPGDDVLAFELSLYEFAPNGELLTFIPLSMDGDIYAKIAILNDNLIITENGNLHCIAPTNVNSPCFSTINISDFIINLTIQEDGKILVVSPLDGIFRYLPDGTPDVPFNTTINLSSFEYLTDVDVLENDELLVTGKTQMMKFDLNGSNIMDFGNNGIVNLFSGRRNQSIVSRLGIIYTLLADTQDANPFEFHKYNAEGVLQNSILLNYPATGFSCDLHDILILPNDDILISSGCEHSHGQIVYMKPNGQIEYTEGSTTTLAIQGSKVLAGGTREVSTNVPWIEDSAMILSRYQCSSDTNCTGNLNLPNQFSINRFAFEHPNCTHFGGNVTIGHSSSSNLSDINDLSPIFRMESVVGELEFVNISVPVYAFDSLREVGALTLERNYQLSDLSGFSNLKTIHSDLKIIRNNALSDLTGLEQANISGDLNISSNHLLDNLSGLNPRIDSLQSCAIAHNDELKNLSGLDSLRVLEGSLTISNNGSLNTLTHLNLTSVHWQVSITDNPLLTDLEAFDHTNSLSNLFINNNQILPNLNGLNTINTIEGQLQINNNGSLKNLSGLNNANTIGYLTLESNDSLINLLGIENLHTLEHIYIHDNPSLTSLHPLQADSVGGIRIFFNTGLTNLSGFENIRSTSQVFIESNPLITNLSGLDSLNAVYGQVYIYNNDNLVNLSGLENLDYVEESLTLDDNDDLGTLIHLNVSSVGSLVIRRNVDLTQLNGLEELTSVSGIRIENNPNIQNLRGLDSISSISGSLYIGRNFALNSMLGLEQLEEIDGTFDIIDNFLLSNLDGLNNLQTIGNRLFVTENPSLGSLSGLNNLHSVGNAVHIHENDSLANLMGLENIQTIGTRLEVRDNANITQLTGLNDTLNVPNIYLRDNDQLSMCEHPAICRHLMLNRFINIQNNASGCNDLSELADCIVAVEVPSKPDFIITPNPNTGIFEVNDIPRGTYQIHDTTGRIIQSGNMKNDLSIDISKEAQGLYFISIQIENETITKRMIKM